MNGCSRNIYRRCYVSVSSRSYILSYMHKLIYLNEFIKRVFPSPLGVIFSLIRCLWKFCKLFTICFRLLSELYSLLFKNSIKLIDDDDDLFPSPLGVIFSLMEHNTWSCCNYILIFVSVSSRSYILSYPILKKLFVCNSL